MKEINYTCGDCLFLNKDDGKPYYCSMKELYNVQNEDDEICNRFEYKEITNTDKAFKI